MSRIGRKPIAIPAGVTVTVDEQNFVTVKGGKGTLTATMHPDMSIKVEGTEVLVTRPSDVKEHRSLHGLTRTLIANMIEGVTNGYKKELKISGVGYRAQMQGTKLVMNLGYSHPVEVDAVPGITIEVTDPNTVVISGTDKQLVGQFAANVRGKRAPEPYKGAGIRYSDEVIKRKEGKAGKGK
ncbi:MAG: 50S ribosomal protein L6 [Clostridia bacterium]|nr:50S ribosomal protein L6 [Clostridia bacterium]